MINISMSVDCRGYNSETEEKIHKQLIRTLSDIVKKTISEVQVPSGMHVHPNDILVEGKITIDKKVTA